MLISSPDTLMIYHFACPGAGQPWPMPQAYRAENISLVVDVDGFTIHRPVKTCNRVNRAIARYTNHIKSKV